MKRPVLLDLNILIALAWPSHIHHSETHRWFSQEQTHGWATCPITQSGFVRLSSNPKILPEAVSPQAAWLLLEQITRLPNHSFWADSIALTDSVIFRNANIIGYRQVTDAYLLSLAIHSNSQLISFDKEIRSILPNEYRGHLKILDEEIV